MSRKHWQRISVSLVFGIMIGFASLDLDRLPALWWDEGWTMNVARHWVEQGHYGQLLNGQPVTPGLTAALPSVASVALSFRLFGVGAWQARLPFVIYTLIALGQLYWLGRRLFDRSVATVAIGLLLVTATDPFVSPVFVGRQVLAEPIMLTALLSGYLCLGLALSLKRRWPIGLAGAIGLFALGLIAKSQPLPFWAISLVLPLIVVALNRQWRVAGVLGISLIGGYGLMRVLNAGLAAGLYPMAPASLPGLVEMTALVVLPQIRLTVAAMTLQMALPTVAGLIAFAGQWLGRWRTRSTLDARAVLRLTVFGFAGSWLAWYVLLSRGVPRYAMPGLWVGSLFAANLVVKALHRIRQRGRLRVATVASWMLMAALLAMLVLNVTWVMGLLRVNVYPGVAAQDAAEYINTHASANALVETYESEVMFYLQRRYHFPPDELHVTLVRQQLDNYDRRQGVSGSDMRVNYDPLAADPDYLIVGPPDNLWYAPYAGAISSGAFRPVFTAGRYQVLERVR